MMIKRVLSARGPRNVSTKVSAKLRLNCGSGGGPASISGDKLHNLDGGNHGLLEAATYIVCCDTLDERKYYMLNMPACCSSIEI